MKATDSAKLRRITASLLFTLAIIGAIAGWGTGTFSAFGPFDIAAICPLGALEALLASKTVIPRAAIGLAVTLVIILLAGRAFCAWVCPVPLVERLLGRKRTKSETHCAKAEKCKRCPSASKEPSPSLEHGRAAEEDHGDQLAKRPRPSRFWVLGGVLGSTTLFGFPVFCAICPIGLTFASVIAIWRLLAFNESVLTALVFPLLLAAELILARNWCHRFCPLSALMSLIARTNRTFVPRVDAKRCLRSTGATCGKCASACPEGIDLHKPAKEARLHDCTKCRACVDACPAKAISFPILKSKAGKQERIGNDQ